jgi:hypothetical protein
MHMNRTTLGLVAILAAATLVITTLAAPAFASVGDGNTLTKQNNKAKAIASGFGTLAANIQLNTICFETAPCVR